LHDTYEKIYCRICNKLFSRITERHTIPHGLTVKTYKEQFPDAPTVSQQSDETKKKAAVIANSSRKGIPRSTEVIEKIKSSKSLNPKPAWNKGIPRTKEQNQHLSLVRKQRFQSGKIIHWNTGKTTSEETKQKTSNTALSQHRHYSSESLEKRNITIDDKKQNGWVHHSVFNRGKPANLTEESRRRIRDTSTLTNEKRTTLKNDRITELLTIHDLELQTTDGYNYSIKCKACNTLFTRTVSVFAPYRYELYSGEYCPICYPVHGGYYSEDLFNTYPEMKQLPGILYVARLYDDCESFIKIGITQRDALTRLRNELSIYKFEVLFEHNMTIEQAFYAEQYILSEFVDYKYQPNKDFGGKTECFTVEVLKELLDLEYSVLDL